MTAMTLPLRILIVEDSANDAELTLLELARDGIAPEARRVESAAEMRTALAEGPWDAVLSDYTMPGFGATEAFALCRTADPDLPFVVVSGTIGEQRAVEMMRAGAGDYLLKGNLTRLPAAVRREVREAEGRRGRRKAERKARDLAAIVASSDDAIVGKTLDGIVTSWNAGAERLYGYAADEIVGRSIAPLISPDRPNEEVGLLGRVASGERVEHFETDRVRKDGTRVYISITLSPVRDEKGQVVGASAIARDIGDRRRQDAALRASEARLLKAQQVANIGSWENDLATLHVTWSAQTYRIFEILPESGQMTHQRFLELVHPDDRANVQKAFLESLTYCSPGETTYRIRTPVGTAKSVEEHWQVEADEEGKPIRVVGTCQDVTDRTRSEEVLRYSEERYRSLVDATAAIVWDSPASGAFNSEQPGWTKFTGQTVEQHREWGWLDAIHPDDREKTARAWEAAVATQTVYLVEHRLRKADGEYRHMTVRAIPILDDGGAIREWVGVHTDVTERQRMEEQYHHAERRLRHVVASSPVVLFTLALAADQIRGLDWIGENLLSVLGHRPEEALSPDWWQANVHPEDLDRATAQAQDGLFGHGQATHEYRFRHGDGEYRWTRGDLRLIRDAAGRPVEAVGSWSDISERKSLEEQFRQAQKMEAVGQLAGGVAHDFNNLLTIINGYGEIVHAALPQDHPSRPLVAEIQNAGDRAAGLTRQLLAFSRQTVLETRVLDVNDLVRNLESMLQRLIGEDVDLATRLAWALGRAKADPGQLEQAIVNLCVNARDAMPRGGQITIETQNVELDEAYVGAHPDVLPGPYILVAVTDTGAGMTPEVRARIFEPFYTTKGAGKGTGLGLAMVFGFAKQSGGHVAVYSEPGRGATFKLYLPLVAETPSVKSTASPTVMPKGTETVLLVEDEDAVRALGRHVLQLCGYAVLEAGHGREAVRVAAGHAGPIHLLVTDVVMPGGMGGREVAEAVVSLYPEAQVLYTSGYTDDAVVRHGVLEAGTHFLQKPFAPAAFAGKVRTILDSTAIVT